MSARGAACTDCGRTLPDVSGQPPRCADCLTAGDPPVFGVAASGAAYCRLERAGALSPRVRASFLDCVTVDASAMSHATTWAPRRGARLAPDDAAHLEHVLYELSGGATRPHERRDAITAAARLFEQFLAAPKLTPKKRTPDTYCFRCGEPVPGGLFLGNSHKGARGFSWVNADGLSVRNPATGEVTHNAHRCPPGMGQPTFTEEDDELYREEEEPDDQEQDDEPAPTWEEHIERMRADDAARARRATSPDQLDLFADAPPAHAERQTPALMPPIAPGAACQLDMFSAAPGVACPHCGARKTYADGIDDARATRRAYTCDNCARTWSVDGAQLDLLADPVSAPAMRAED